MPLALKPCKQASGGETAIAGLACATHVQTTRPTTKWIIQICSENTRIHKETQSGESFSQYVEHTTIIAILEHAKIMGWGRQLRAKPRHSQPWVALIGLPVRLTSVGPRATATSIDLYFPDAKDIQYIGINQAVRDMGNICSACVWDG